jgi:hypothetical protein
MGRYVKKRDDTTSMHYWYPGQKVDWVQAGIAAGSGLAATAVIRVITGSWMWGAAAGFSVTAALAGLYLGRRDARALAIKEVGKLSGAVLIGMAFLRALAKGSGAALAAVVVARLASPGFGAHWILPLVPAVIGAIAHHLGMFYEQLEKAAAVPVKASHSEVAKAVAERRQSLAAAAAGAAQGDAAQAGAAGEDGANGEPAPQPIGAAVSEEEAAALPGESEDTAQWEDYPGPYGPQEAARSRSRGAGGRRAVFSRRRPGLREVV